MKPSCKNNAASTDFPCSKELNRERKVVGRQAKEKKRKGTKGHNDEIVVDSVDFAGIDKIYCGDSEEVLKDFPDDCVDIVVTSPPYNFGLDYDSDHNKDAVYWKDYFAKLNRIWEQCYRVLKPGGRMCVNVQPLFSDYMPTHHLISKQLLDLGLLWKSEILWEKNNYNCKYTAWGSWKSPSMPYMKYTWEFVEVFCKESHKKAGDSSKIDITGEEFKQWVYAKWSIAPERNMKKYDHPAMFPKQLVARLLKLFSYEGDVVLDPFLGVGTTAVCAYDLNRHYVGIDISEQYCETAEKRMTNVRKQMKLSLKGTAEELHLRD